MYPIIWIKGGGHRGAQMKGFGKRRVGEGGGGEQGSEVKKRCSREAERSRVASGAISNGGWLTSSCACRIFMQPVTFEWLNMTLLNKRCLDQRQTQQALELKEFSEEPPIHIYHHCWFLIQPQCIWREPLLSLAAAPWWTGEAKSS